MTETKYNLQLQLICLVPPPTTFNGTAASQFGLQNKKGMLDLGEAQADGSRVFTCFIQATMSDNGADFSGAYIQGTKGKRFLYLSWAYDTGGWVQRIKVPLTGLSPEQVQSGKVLQAIIPDGRASATVKPQDGWKTV